MRNERCELEWVYKEDDSESGKIYCHLSLVNYIISVSEV